MVMEAVHCPRCTVLTARSVFGALFITLSDLVNLLSDGSVLHIFPSCYTHLFRLLQNKLVGLSHHSINSGTFVREAQWPWGKCKVYPSPVPTDDYARNDITAPHRPLSGDFQTAAEGDIAEEFIVYLYCLWRFV